MAVSTSLIFGLDPDDPSKKDPFETFMLGAVPFSPFGLVDPGLPPSEVMALFEAFDDTPVSPGKTFMLDDPPAFPSEHDIEIDELGMSFIEATSGSELVLTGWMPTWSFDARVGSNGKPLKGSELIWGFSDITGPSGPKVAKPVLTIEYTPVPEPLSILAFAGGLALVRRKRGRKGS